MPPRRIGSGPSLDDVKHELQSITASPIFAHSARQAKLLEYVCNKVLLGEAAQIKAATIAMEVFGRPWDFDESRDSIVRVEAHRLRQKLARYYEQQGAKDPVRIVLIPGSYVPEFHYWDEPAPDGTEINPASPPPAEPAGPAPPAVPTGTLPAPGSPRNRTLIATAWVSVLLLAGGGMMLRHAGGSTPVPPSVAQQPAIPPPGSEVRILAGFEGSVYADRFGQTWGPDRYFQGGTAEPGPKEFLGRPPDAGLFLKMRTGEFSYNIPAPPGSYSLRLYWAEPIFRTATETNGGGENERRFNVSINGKVVLPKFDVVADSGIAPVDIRAFRDVAPEPDGMIHVRFSAVYGTPFVNALELIRMAGGRVPPIRLRAHELSFTDREGRSWTPDNYFVGGRLATHKYVVTGTDEPDVYAGERYGNFNYLIPVPPGSYSVTLHFAETWFRPDSDGQDHGGRGDRVFEVYANGAALMRNFDMFAVAGRFQAITRTFHGIRPNGQGKIILTFTPLVNYASVKAIEIAEDR